MSLTHVSLLWQLIFKTHFGATTNTHSDVHPPWWSGSMSLFFFFQLCLRLTDLFWILCHQSSSSQGCLRSLHDVWDFQSFSLFYCFWHPRAFFWWTTISVSKNWTECDARHISEIRFWRTSLYWQWNLNLSGFSRLCVATLPLHPRLPPARHVCHPQIALSHCCDTGKLISGW